MSAFMDEWNVASGDLDAAFAKSFRLLPRTKTDDRNAPVIPDPARGEVDFVATLHTPKAKALITNAYDARTDQRPGTSSQHPLLRITPAALRASGLVTRPDDLVLDVAQNVRWRISSQRTTGTGTRECVVELIG